MPPHCLLNVNTREIVMGDAAQINQLVACPWIASLGTLKLVQRVGQIRASKPTRKDNVQNVTDV